MEHGTCNVTTHPDGVFTWEFDPPDCDVVLVTRDALDMLLSMLASRPNV